MKKILEICCKGRTATTAPVEPSADIVPRPGSPQAAAEVVPTEAIPQPAEGPAAPSIIQVEAPAESAAVGDAIVAEETPSTSDQVALTKATESEPVTVTPKKMIRFEGKAVIVTGSSSGIGREAIILFAEEGACVTVHGQSVERIEATKQRLLQAGVVEDRIVTVQGAIQDTDTQHRIVNETVGKFGRIDVLINNAGVMKKSDVPEDAIENFDFTFEVNVRSVIQLTDLCLPHLQQAKGAIVNVSSMLAVRPAPTMNFYSISKAAIDHYTRNMAVRCATHGVRVNSINPGVVYSDFHTRQGMSSEARDEFEKSVADSTLLGRSGQPVEIAKIVVVLASNDASYVAGANWLVDGGRAIFTPNAVPTLYETTATES